MSGSVIDSAIRASGPACSLFLCSVLMIIISLKPASHYHKVGNANKNLLSRSAQNWKVLLLLNLKLRSIVFLFEKIFHHLIANLLASLISESSSDIKAIDILVNDRTTQLFSLIKFMSDSNHSEISLIVFSQLFWNKFAFHTVFI